MKVLFVTQWYPNQSQKFFGIFVREHARAVVLAGHDVQVLSLSLHYSQSLFKRRIYQHTDENGINLTQCELHSRFKDLFYHLPMLQYFLLQKLLKHSLSISGKPDLVHSHVIYPAGIWGDKIARKFNIPHVITEHWSRLDDFSRSMYFTKGKNAYNAAKAIMPVSLFLKNKIQTHISSLPDKQFQVIGNVVDTNIFNYTEEKTDEETLTFCAVATWMHKKKPDKMPELFIDALAVLQNKVDKKINLIMIGGGNKVPDLRKLCAQKGLNTQFTGFLPKEKIVTILRKSKFFVHASHVETFSIVVAEALACGLPVICSNTGALPELIDTDNGILCENTSEAWEAAISNAVNMQFDRRLIARKISDRFSLEAISKRVSSVYAQTIES